MPRIVKCRFCGRQVLTHDHDECALKFEKFLLEKGKMSFLQAGTEGGQGNEWGGYQEYLARKESEKLLHIQRKRNEARIRKEIEAILKSSRVVKKLKKLNTPSERKSFRFKIEVKVRVEVVPTY